MEKESKNKVSKENNCEHQLFMPRQEKTMNDILLLFKSIYKNVFPVTITESGGETERYICQYTTVNNWNPINANESESGSMEISFKLLKEGEDALDSNRYLRIIEKQQGVPLVVYQIFDGHNAKEKRSKVLGVHTKITVGEGEKSGEFFVY